MGWVFECKVVRGRNKAAKVKNILIVCGITKERLKAFRLKAEGCSAEGFSAEG
jgi:hypothetical protein